MVPRGKGSAAGWRRRREERKLEWEEDVARLSGVPKHQFFYALAWGYRDEVWNARAAPNEAKEDVSVCSGIFITICGVCLLVAMGILVLLDKVATAPKWFEVIAFTPALVFNALAVTYGLYWLVLIRETKSSGKRVTHDFRRVYNAKVVRSLTVTALAIGPLASVLLFG